MTTEATEQEKAAELYKACVLIQSTDTPVLTRFIEEKVTGSDEPPDFIFVGPGGSGRATAKQLLEFRYAEPALEVATGQVLDLPVKPQTWRLARARLMAGRTCVLLGEEASVSGQARAWLRAHLVEYTILEGEHWDSSLQTGRPVRDKDGHVWFAPETIFAGKEMDRVRVDRRGIMRAWRAIGCGATGVPKHYLTRDGRRTTRTMYRVGEDFLASVLPPGPADPPSGPRRRTRRKASV